MRICIVTHCFPRFKNDIFGNWTPDFARLLTERGHEIFVLTPQMAGSAEPGDEETWPFRVIYFDWGGGKTRLGNLNLLNPVHSYQLISFLRNGSDKLKSLDETFNIDFNLGIWTIPGGYLCNRVQKARGIPYAVWTLGSDINVYGRNLLFRYIIKQILRQADYLFANSRNMIETVSKWSEQTCGFMPTNRILTFKRNESLEEHGEENNFVYIGRLEKVKGVDVLIEALAELKNEGFHAHLHIIGDGDQRHILERNVSQAHLTEHVTFVGWASPEVVASYIQASDAVVIPSRSEGMPVVFWESMQMDTPVIVTDVGDMADYTRRYSVGKVVPPEDAHTLKDALRGMIKGTIDINYENIRLLASESSLEKSVDTFLLTIESNDRVKI